MTKTKLLKTAFVATIPVMAGYVVLGIGFGMILKTKGYGLIWSFAMSLFIYAGSMQFVLIDLLTGGGIPAHHGNHDTDGECPPPLLQHFHGGRI